MAETRREQLLALLHEAAGPVTGASLAARLGVTRQVVVQDVAILRARGVDILSTPQGYLIPAASQRRRIVAVRHTREQIRDELNAIVDEGARVVDVVVEHALYGEIRGLLMCSSRRDVAEFCRKLDASGAEPLLVLTDGVHLHTVEAPDQATLDRVEAALRQRGYLVEGE